MIGNDLSRKYIFQRVNLERNLYVKLAFDQANERTSTKKTCFNKYEQHRECKLFIHVCLV